MTQNHNSEGSNPSPGIVEYEPCDWCMFYHDGERAPCHKCKDTKRIEKKIEIFEGKNYGKLS